MKIRNSESQMVCDMILGVTSLLSVMMYIDQSMSGSVFLIENDQDSMKKPTIMAVFSFCFIVC